MKPLKRRFDLSRINHLHAWAHGKPFAVAIATFQAIAMSPIMIDLVGFVRRGEAARIIRDQAGEADWLGLYRNPDHVIESLRSIWVAKDNPTVTAKLARFLSTRQPQDITAAQDALDRLPPHGQARAKEFNYWMWRTLYVEQCQAIAGAMNDEDALPSVDMDEAIKRPEMQFAALVMVPALLEYGQSATQIYDGARKGDRQALDQLIRLDKSVLGDPDILSQVKRFGMERDVGAAGIVARFCLTNPKSAGIAG